MTIGMNLYWIRDDVGAHNNAGFVSIGNVFSWWEKGHCDFRSCYCEERGYTSARYPGTCCKIALTYLTYNLYLSAATSGDK
ncbi:hypothetical protein Plhal304r1_c035g0108791 [Plasmopara halstedii]